MPAPKSKVEFPDPDQYTDLVDLRKQIRDVILELRSLMRKGEDSNTLVEFTSVIHPGTFADPGRLPRDSSDGRSRSKRKEECLFAAISKLIQDYWDTVWDDTANPISIKSVKAQLEALKEIQKRSLAHYKAEGNERQGYTLA